MTSWWKRKPKEAPWQSWQLSGEIGAVSLPGFLNVEMEGSETLLASLADELVLLRFSSISFTKKGEAAEDIAKNYVRKRSAEDQHPYYEVAEKGISSHEERSEQNGEPIVIKYWYVGAKSTMVIVSATVLSSNLHDARARELLGLMPRILESVIIHKIHAIATYAGHEVPITEQQVESGEQAIKSFGPADSAWLDESRQLAALLSVKYGSGGDLAPAELDVIFARWMFDIDEKDSDEAVASALGAAFGDFLVEQHGFRWVVVTDQYGTEYAVRHQVGSTMAFPRSSVAKRIETREPECFQNLQTAVLGYLRQRAEEDAR